MCLNIYFISLFKINNKYQMKIEKYKLARKQLQDKDKTLQMMKQFNKKVKNYLSIMEVKDQLVATICSFLHIPQQSANMRQYIQNNLPIEINFKALTTQQIKIILAQWLTFMENNQNSSNNEEQNLLQTFAGIRIKQDKISTKAFRNTLFNAVIENNKQNIFDYFNTLSSENKLKPVDIYQLINQIFSPYFLYLTVTDEKHFFQTINSYETFVNVAELYLKTTNNVYIYQSQLPKLFLFLQQYWPQLQLCCQERSIFVNESIDTEVKKTTVKTNVPQKLIIKKPIINDNCVNQQSPKFQVLKHNQQIQTQNQNLLDFINNCLLQLNRFALGFCNGTKLQSVQRISVLMIQQKLRLKSQFQNTQSTQLIPNNINFSSSKQYSKFVSPQKNKPFTKRKQHVYDQQNKSKQAYIKNEQQSIKNEQTQQPYPKRSAQKFNIVTAQNKDTSFLSQQLCVNVHTPTHSEVPLFSKKSVNIKQEATILYNFYRKSGLMTVDLLQKMLCELGAVNDATFIYDLRKRGVIGHVITKEDLLIVFDILMKKDRQLTKEVIYQFAQLKNIQYMKSQLMQQGTYRRNKEYY